MAGHDSGSGLSAAERERLDEIRSAERLADLVRITDADSEHAAYFEAKREWADLREAELAARPTTDGLPGDRVVIDGREFHVHGITHGDTRAEGQFLREHVSAFLDAGAAVYCEQGVRPMYFAESPGVREMDDYTWAMDRIERLDGESHVHTFREPEFDGFVEDVDTLAARFRELAFSLIDSGSDLYGEAFASAVGDVASAFLTSHEDVAIGVDFESFTASRLASTDPGHLRDLQNYYRKVFLPQPLEREWLRRHDRELELATHARNERMADYAVYHSTDAPSVHLIVGAAHQPGVTYYLERYRDGRKRLEGFEPVG